jgi:hypothetical protein
MSSDIIPHKSTVDIDTVPPDLIVPEMGQGKPEPGVRVRQTTSGYERTQVHHALYLPEDWQPKRKCPLIVEFAGNHWKTSPGTVEGSQLGYGVSGGKQFIWLCMPYLNEAGTTNVGTWWGDEPTYRVRPTIDYCVKTVRSVCDQYNGDSNNVILSGFSRGAIACNYIGLHDDDIATLWRAFICFSHYDGYITGWPYPAADRVSASRRLKRLKGRPQFICAESNVRKEGEVTGQDLEGLRHYIESTGVEALFTFAYTGFKQHDDGWTLRPGPTRTVLREWLNLTTK